jgi:hypothetical protein
MSTRARIAARYEAALMKNAGARPTLTMSTPALPGPIMRARFTTTEFRLTALVT